MIASFTHQARFILAISLLLGQVVRVSSQGTVDASDLPFCAGPCASTAAIAAGCKLVDTACLCSHPAFADATRSCAISACGIEDRSSVNSVLNDMCSAAPPTNTSSSSSSAPSPPSGTATSSSQTSQSASGSQGTQSPNSSASSTGTAASSMPSAPGTIYTTSQSQSSSSTAVVVQTVVLPQTTNFSRAVSREFGVVGLGLVGQAVMALVGGACLLLL